MNYQEKRDETRVAFVGQQDGEPERELKRSIAEVLGQFPSVQKAYLATVRYGGSDQLWVALCLYGASESAEIVAACTRTFEQMFNCSQSLDVLFISSEQEECLAKVCPSFFARSLS